MSTMKSQSDQYPESVHQALTPLKWAHMLGNQHEEADSEDLPR